MTVLPRLLIVECPALMAPFPVPALPAAPGRPEEGEGRRLRIFARMVDALAEVCPWIDPVRTGVCTLPIRGPARYFGSEDAVLARVIEIVAAVVAPELALPGGAPAALARLGVAEGLFAATLAARSEAVVAEGGTVAFLAPWPVDVLGEPDLADLLTRLGLSTLGRFAALPAADVLARFGASGGHCHRVARGLEGELPGWRMPGMGRRLVAALGRELALTEHQPGFWGGVSAAEERAAEVFTDLQRRLGPEAVASPVLMGGRGPSDRCHLVPWRPAGAVVEDGSIHHRRAADGRTRPARPVRGTERPVRGTDRPVRGTEPPWPGRLPPPAPARVVACELAECTAAERSPAGRAAVAEVVDDRGAPVAVTARGLLTGRPVRLSVGGAPWEPVAGWSAPWPVEERWWSRGRRRAARLQVLAGDEVARAYLLVVERGRWRVEAVYD